MNFSKKNHEHLNIKKYMVSKNLSIIIIFLMSLLGSVQSTEAQFLKKLKKRAEEAAKETVSRKVEDKTAQKTEKVMDTILNADKKIIGKGKGKKGGNKGNGEMYDENASEEFKMYSKFDFVPGNKILLFDDFSLDNIGDFPSKWNTDGTGELITIDDEKWFMLTSKSTYIPDVSKSLPKDYTIEFDMLTNELEGGSTSAAILKVLLHNHNSFNSVKDAVDVGIRVGQYVPTKFLIENKVNGSKVIRNTVEKDVRSVILDITHVSIAVIGKRFRMWLNENKVVDVPRLVPDNITSFKLYPWGLGDGQLFITNLKIADGGQDLRGKLLNDGKYSTTGILFNSGSDQIKPESYGVLKQIAYALQQEKDMNLNIIGHTDTDGDDKLNLALSEQRAQAVKNILVSQFNIDEGRLQTEGKGESEPVSDNNTSEGKANNRRVEFVKI